MRAPQEVKVSAVVSDLIVHVLSGEGMKAQARRRGTSSASNSAKLWLKSPEFWVPKWKSAAEACGLARLSQTCRRQAPSSEIWETCWSLFPQPASWSHSVPTLWELLHHPWSLCPASLGTTSQNALVSVSQRPTSPRFTLPG